MDTSFFQFFQIFFKVEAVSLYFSTNPFSDQKKQILCLVETVFFIRAIFLRVENIIGIRADQFFLKKTYSWLWTVASFFYPIFQRPLPMFILFPPSENVFFYEILYLDQWKWILGLKKLKIQEYCFHQTKCFIPPARTKDLLNRYISMTRKSCFNQHGYLETNIENNLQYQERSYSLKNGGTLI